MPDAPSETPLVVAPLWPEALALRSARTGAPMAHVGMRAGRAAALREAAAARPGAPVVIAGLAGGLQEFLSPGDVVVADEVRSAEAAIACPGGESLAARLARAGSRVHVGPVFESGHIVEGTARARLAGEGAMAVDMESTRLVRMLGRRPVDVVRVVVDTPHRPLRHPATLSGGWLALRTLRAIAPALAAPEGRGPDAGTGEHETDKEKSKHR